MTRPVTWRLRMLERRAVASLCRTCTHEPTQKAIADCAEAAACGFLHVRTSAGRCLFPCHQAHDFAQPSSLSWHARGDSISDSATSPSDVYRQ